MRASFDLPIKPLSINATYHDFGMTADAKQWFHTVFHYLDKKENQEKLETLRKFFDPTLHSLRFSLTMFAPKEIFYTKAGTMSGRLIDATNWEKSVVDAFCLSKHADKPAPYGVKNLMTDDRYVKRLFSQKVVGTSWAIRVSIVIGPK